MALGFPPLWFVEGLVRVSGAVGAGVSAVPRPCGLRCRVPWPAGARGSAPYVAAVPRPRLGLVGLVLDILLPFLLVSGGGGFAS